MMKLIRFSEFQTMPWKNGLGSTKEIEIFPAGSQMSDGSFLWRLSSATVAANSSFSQFQGYDRWLTVLSGKGLWLNQNYLAYGYLCLLLG
jgi:environmental stress-induced protein Ves